MLKQDTGELITGHWRTNHRRAAYSAFMLAQRRNEAWTKAVTVLRVTLFRLWTKQEVFHEISYEWKLSLRGFYCNNMNRRPHSSEGREIYLKTG